MSRWLYTLPLSFCLVATAAASEEPARPLRFDVPHRFTQAEAHVRVEQLFTYWRGRFGVKTRWEGERAFVTGVIRGIPIDAVLDVGATRVGGSANDPGFFLRGTAHTYIKKKLQKYLHPTYMEP